MLQQNCYINHVNYNFINWVLTIAQSNIKPEIYNYLIDVQAIVKNHWLIFKNSSRFNILFVYMIVDINNTII